MAGSGRWARVVAVIFLVGLAAGGRAPQPAAAGGSIGPATRMVQPATGQPEPPRPVVAPLVARAALPVYGPAGAPFGLRLLTVASAPDINGSITGAQLLFGDFVPEGTRVALSVISELPRPWQLPRVDAEAAATGYNPFHDIYIDLQLDSRGAPRSYPTGLPEVTDAAVMIDGSPRPVTLACWTQDNGFCAYQLAVEGAALSGGVLGLPAEDVLAVLATLLPLPAHPELVEQYEGEYRAHGAAVARVGGGVRPEADPSLRHRLPVPAGTRQSGGVSVSSIGDGGAAPVQFLYDIINLSPHFALMVEDAFPFDGGFTLVLPPGLRPRVTYASGLECRPGETANQLSCRMVEELVQLVFVADGEPGSE